MSRKNELIFSLLLHGNVSLNDFLFLIVFIFVFLLCKILYIVFFLKIITSCNIEKSIYVKKNYNII